MTGLEANPPDTIKTMSECSLLLRNIWTVLNEEDSCDASATRLNLTVLFPKSLYSHSKERLPN